MKKQVVLYKKLSPALMARLQAQFDVTQIESLDADGLMQLRDALPRAHGLLGASLKLDAALLDLAPKSLSPQFFEQLLRLAVAVNDGGTKSGEITCGEGACSRWSAQQT